MVLVGSIELFVFVVVALFIDLSGWDMGQCIPTINW